MVKEPSKQFLEDTKKRQTLRSPRLLVDTDVDVPGSGNWLRFYLVWLPWLKKEICKHTEWGSNPDNGLM